MKRSVTIVAIIFIGILFLHAVAALSVEKVDKGSVLIAELTNPAVFDFTINNPVQEESAQIYTLVGIPMTPDRFFNLPNGTTTLEVRAYPPVGLRKNSGFLTFEYQIKGERSGIFSDKIRVKVVPLKEIIKISAERLSPNDSDAVILVENNENTHIQDLSLRLSSPFFDATRKISFKPYETVRLRVPFDHDVVKNLAAGSYILNADAELQGAKQHWEGVLNYVEKKDVSETTSSEGAIVRKTTVTKTNDGNVPETVSITMSKDVISRLFTLFSVEPQTSTRSGLFVSYTWEKQLDPASSFTVTSTTNYTMPLIFLLLIIVIAVFVRMILRTHVTLHKRVSFVRTRGGEFALKVRLHLKANKYVENLQIIDRLPGMTVLYDRFGIKPDTIDHSTRRLIWKVQRLNAGEERVFSYIVYSKIKVVGRFELPSAVTIFERDGKTEEVTSNRTFFVNETTSMSE
ncbi:MAG: hypothetical protein AABY00_02710 [Nanoarchaeota archaeon]|mgnify:CR=1 FL=1